jgi:hypothetical protein
VDFREIGLSPSPSDVVVMVEAPNPLEVHQTSMSYVLCKVFYYLDMLWMGLWVYPYTVTPVEVGGIILENWVMAELK